MTKAADGAYRRSHSDLSHSDQCRCGAHRDAGENPDVVNADDQRLGRTDAADQERDSAQVQAQAQSQPADQPAHHTVFVTALSGWSDACYAVSDLAQQLMAHYGGTLVKRLCSCKYYDFQQNRPMIATIEGERRLLWPESSITSVDVSPTLTLLVLAGSEPNLYWEDYANACVDVASTYGAERIVSLSSMLDDCPHTRELPMSHWGSVARGDGTLYVPGNGDLDEYHGPVSMGVVLNLIAADAGIPIEAYTVSVPRYMEAEECPQATYDLLKSLSQNVGEPLDTADLEFQSRRWHARGDMMMSINPQLRQDVARLEREHDTSRRIDMELKLSHQPEVCEQLVRETEKFLLDVQLKGVNLGGAEGLFDAHAVAQIKTRITPHAPATPYSPSSPVPAASASAAPRKAPAGMKPHASAQPSDGSGNVGDLGGSDGSGDECRSEGKGSSPQPDIHCDAPAGASGQTNSLGTDSHGPDGHHSDGGSPENA